MNIYNAEVFTTKLEIYPIDDIEFDVLENVVLEDLLNLLDK